MTPPNWYNRGALYTLKLDSFAGQEHFDTSILARDKSLSLPPPPPQVFLSLLRRIRVADSTRRKDSETSTEYTEDQ